MLKKVPEDFIVEEIPLPNFKLKGGRFLIIEVKKRGMNTEEVAKLLAKKLHIPRKYISYAGAKDRQAVTTQRFSILIKDELFKDEAIQKINKIETSIVGRSNEPLSLGQLVGNRFRIIVRSLEGDEELRVPEIVPNYYDEQRFGRVNAQIGRALIKKEFSEATKLIIESQEEGTRVKEFLEEHPNDAVGAILRLPKTLLRIYLHSFQSLIWNRTVGEYLKMICKKRRVIKYSEGEFVIPEESIVDGVKSFPIVGFGTEYPNEKVKELIEEELSIEGISERDFIIKQLPNLSLEGGERDIFMKITDYNASEFSDDELFLGKKKVTLKFTLTKGSYATMVVKTLFGESNIRH